MYIFNKEYLDFLTTSPGNYIFKNKSNKSEFGKCSSLLHLIISFALLIYYLFSYYQGSGLNVIYSKEIKNLVDPNFVIDFDDLGKNNEFKDYRQDEKKHLIQIYPDNYEVLEDKLDLIIEDYNSNEIEKIQYTNIDFGSLTVEFNATDKFKIYINNTEELLSNVLTIEFFYKSFYINNNNKIPMNKNNFTFTEILYIYPKKYNEISLHENYIVYKDGIRLKNFWSYLKFWTHYETFYIDFYYDNYNSFSYDKKDRENEIAVIYASGIIKEINYFERKYDSFFTVLAKWCGLFSSLKILFSSLVYTFSFTYNNYELVKFINQKYESNKILINYNNNTNNIINNSNSINNSINSDNNNNDEDNKKLKNIELNKVNKTKNFNKIKTFDFFKNSFCRCCYSKSKTNRIIKDCNDFVTKHISIEEILYNMLLLENIIEDYKFKDNNILKKFDEMKDKINKYENEMNNNNNNNNKLNEKNINMSLISTE